MGTPMSPSEPITVGQIAKFFDVLSAALRKSGIPSGPTQQVLETQGGALADEFVASVRRRVEAISNMIIRRVKPDPNRTPQQVLDATGRKQYTDGQVVRNMPKGDGRETDVHFFKLGCWISNDDLEKEFDQRGLKPADPYTLAAVNEADPAFADEYPNGTHWKDADGKWCFATFYRWDDERRVNVDRSGNGWSGRWFFAGVSK